jgi:putative RNA 2'-phosphotransferase
MHNELTEVSKFLSLVLRHKPEVIGLSLTPQGWVLIEDLLVAAKAHGKTIERNTLDEVVFTNDKKRFAFSSDGLSIRANQGHSIDVDLELTPQLPPKVLYHGTATRFLPEIQATGLLKMDRQHVHLSAHEDTATRVGARHGKPIVLLVNAEKMSGDGIPFFLSLNGVWLTEYVPPQYINAIA